MTSPIDASRRLCHASVAILVMVAACSQPTRGGSDASSDAGARDVGPSDIATLTDAITAESQAVCEPAETEDECRELGCAGMLEVTAASGAPPDCGDDPMFGPKREICVIDPDWLAGSDSSVLLWRKNGDSFEVIDIAHAVVIDGWNRCSEPQAGEPPECECARTEWGYLVD